MPTPRFVALSAIAFVLLNNVVAGALVAAAYGFDVTLVANPGELVARGPEVAANLLRWGGSIDLVGYLCFAPVVVYWHGRLVGGPLVRRLLTACGLAFVLVGAIGAALLSTVGPWLLEQAPTEAVEVAYGALHHVVLVALWGVLELALLGGWLIGVGRTVRGSFGTVAMVGGVGLLLYSLRTALTGQPPLVMSSIVDLVILVGVAFLPIWTLWFAARLLTGRDTPAVTSRG